jgi:hypothetical protein
MTPNLKSKIPFKMFTYHETNSHQIFQLSKWNNHFHIVTFFTIKDSNPWVMILALLRIVLSLWVGYTIHHLISLPRSRKDLISSKLLTISF